jgi:N-acyl amino acid synthase of PEP-CTERM/exosortase system
MKTLRESSSLSASFHDYFEVLEADTASLKDEVYRIRYEVYCRELAYEDASHFPDHRERDEFDPIARHCLLRHRSSGEFAGCVRLIAHSALDESARLPFEKHCWQSLDPALMFDLRARGVRYGEISRLAVPARFRRRKGEQGNPIGTGDESGQENDQRRSPHIALGLYMAAASVGLEAGLEGVFAMMEPRLARHLKRFGIEFQQAGGVMEYHGQRAAYYISREQLLEGLCPELEDLLFSIRSDLASGQKL